MTKYSNEFKLKVIHEYLDGDIGFAALAEKYNIASKKNITEWVNQYEVTGSIGRIKNESYSFDFKKMVLEYSLNHSYSETSKRFKVFPSAVISSWRAKVDKFGYDGLKNKVRGKRTMPYDKRASDMSYEADQLAKVIEENRRLRMENAVLKKLNALVMQRTEKNKK
ncbi:transposase [Weissella muntiaci]|uniref:Transposase n=1 Tax=Weissella muntiaci TaxID=2508881 RepID=A0A6C2C980_9LACO|nr:transposase [Weissella muntiaci]TYC49993.1 transposase [Weissella muntiaci]